jgi:hypothetical protein
MKRSLLRTSCTALGLLAVAGLGGCSDSSSGSGMHVPEGERAGEAAGLSARPRHPLRPTCARSSSRGVAPGRNTRVASPATPTHATSIATRGSTSPTSTG